MSRDVLGAWEDDVWKHYGKPALQVVHPIAAAALKGVGAGGLADQITTVETKYGVLPASAPKSSTDVRQSDAAAKAQASKTPAAWYLRTPIKSVPLPTWGWIAIGAVGVIGVAAIVGTRK